MPNSEKRAQTSEAGPEWFEARLFNTRGGQVGKVRALPFQRKPEIMVLKDRYFVRRPGTHDYQEAAVHFVTPDEELA